MHQNINPGIIKIYKEHHKQLCEKKGKYILKLFILYCILVQYQINIYTLVWNSGDTHDESQLELISHLRLFIVSPLCLKKAKYAFSKICCD
jgi:hypothetical protein